MKSVKLLQEIAKNLQGIVGELWMEGMNLAHWCYLIAS
jgi:hypothetical protein